MKGPQFTREPPTRLHFSNDTGGKIDCVVVGTPPALVEWILGRLKLLVYWVTDTYELDRQIYALICVQCFGQWYLKACKNWDLCRTTELQRLLSAYKNKWKIFPHLESTNKKKSFSTLDHTENHWTRENWPSKSVKDIRFIWTNFSLHRLTEFTQSDIRIRNIAIFIRNVKFFKLLIVDIPRIRIFSDKKKTSKVLKWNSKFSSKWVFALLPFRVYFVENDLTVRSRIYIKENLDMEKFHHKEDYFSSFFFTRSRRFKW